MTNNVFNLCNIRITQDSLKESSNFVSKDYSSHEKFDTLVGFTIFFLIFQMNGQKKFSLKRK